MVTGGPSDVTPVSVHLISWAAEACKGTSARPSQFSPPKLLLVPLWFWIISHETLLT